MKRTLYIITLAALAISCNHKFDDGNLEPCEISVNPVVENTKSSLIDSDSLTHKRIHLDAYLQGQTKKHIDGNMLFENGKWKFYTTVLDVHYYWPQKSNLDVLAYSPSDLSKTAVTAIDKTTVTFTDIPLSDSLQTAKNFEEFICGKADNCKQADGDINVKLKRPLAVVNIYLGEAVRSDVYSIEIEGIYNSGTYTVATGAWNITGSEGNFHCGVNKNYPTEINNKSKLGGPFLVIPQSLRGDDESDYVKMTFRYKTKGNDNPTVTETKLGKAATVTHTTIGAWEAGKVYDYYISLYGSAGEVKMSITVNEWEIKGSSDVELK